MNNPKTIFISLFEGVEAKNILRTGIVPTVLSHPDVRIVFLMKSQERAKLYQEEFNNPRLAYEVVPYSRSPGRGMDRFFSFLKFLLLKTATTDFMRRSAYKASGDFLVYYVGRAANFLLARPLVRRAARFLDFLLVRKNLYTPLFDKYNPALVFLAHLFEEPEIHILREAKRKNIKSIGFINSWDKVTARCVMRLLPDKVVVFNDLVRKELMKHDEVAEDKIFVAGLPQYDDYFHSAPRDRDKFFRGISTDPKKKLIVYAPLGSAFGDSDWEMIDFLHRLNSDGKFGKDTALLVRFHPKDFIDARELTKRPHLIYDYTGSRFPSKMLVDWDMNREDLLHLRDTLSHMDLLICYASSLSIDAAIFDKPIININFEVQKRAGISRPPTWFYEMEHYKKAVDTRGIRLVSSESELVSWVNLYLENPALDREGRRKLVEEQCRFTDGKSGERIGKFILENL